MLGLYRKLNKDTRLIFEERMIEHLSDLAQDRESHWIDKGGDYLLLSTAYIFLNSSRKDYPIDFLLFIVSHRDDMIDTKPNLHWRACQDLVSLDHRASSSFWEEIFFRGGPSYGGVVFAGLSIIDPNSAFNWLMKNALNSSALDALIIRLPLFIDILGSMKVSRHIIQIYSFLPEENRQEELLQRAFDLEIPISEGVLLIFSDRELIDLAAELEIKFPENIYSIEDMRSFLSEHIIAKHPEPGQYSNPTDDILLISSISKFIYTHPDTLSSKFKTHFFRMGKMISRTLDPQDIDTTTFSGEVLQISRGVNITTELAELREEVSE